ncbi:hypothetical protein DFJ63DRAFT_321667 [Scheffersomyces coipomensis]|uniref:uncharacterized protein n=1 Tax=Scheffersomyces coipomensis TaxID=1788519 RepID=UPI00315DCDB0
MSGQTYFITGANRGIGLELVKKYASLNNSNVVIATARDPTKAKELIELTVTNPNVKVIQLDVGDEKSIDKIDEQLEGLGIKGIDTFINNGALGDSFDSLFKTESKTFYDHFRVNTIGPILTVQKLYKYLVENKTRKIVFISTVAASLTQFMPVNTTAYGESKVALNHAALQFSNELKAENFIVVPLHPGVVGTDMGAHSFESFKDNGPEIMGMLNSLLITPVESASSISKVVEGLKPEDSGKFFNYKGEEEPY